MKDLVITSLIPGAMLIAGAVISDQTGNGLILIWTIAATLVWSAGSAAVYLWHNRHMQYTAEERQLFKMITW
jgi:hypothetical protein